jgi:hypothetical protein
MKGGAGCRAALRAGNALKHAGYKAVQPDAAGTYM